MYRSVANIQSATAEIRRGIKKKIEITGQKYNVRNSASATQGGHKNDIVDSPNIWF